MNQVTLKLISAVQALREVTNAVELRARKLEIADCLLALLGFPEAAGATLWPEVPKKLAGMAIPTLEQVRLHCAKAGILPRDADWFWYKMNANGWKNDGRPVKCWTSTLSAWKLAGHLPSQKQQSTHQFNGSSLRPVGVNEIRRDVERMHQQIKREEQDL